ncbi:hypothetical protein PG994_013565 [Apiospora phragmitis]|uniref:Uncharacterized protein n=1 Tax=Apiospora phragmitis TaxID=2905665 RepID=A0ABR1T903_9PEZI
MSRASQPQHPGGGSSHSQNGQLILHPQAHPQSSHHSSHPASAAGATGHQPTAQPSLHTPGGGARHVRFASPDPGLPLSAHPGVNPNAGQAPFGQNYPGQGGQNYYANPPPAMGPPAQQPPPAYPYYQQYGGAPARPARWQDRPIEVALPNSLVFHCNRADILFHLPATRQEPFGRRLYPYAYLAPANRTPAAEDGLRHLFRQLEQYRLQAIPVRLFDRAADLLDRADCARAGYYAASRLFVGLCAVLDKEWGLGCSDALLNQIDEFALFLMEGYDAAFNQPRVLVDLLNAYSQVFQPSTPRHLQTVRAVWRALPLFARSMVAQSLWGRTATAPKTSSRSAFVRILRDMSLF